MHGNVLGRSIAFGLLKLSRIRLWVSGQINSPTDDSTEDEVLNFGVQGLIVEMIKLIDDLHSVHQMIKY